jgi:hypothetical protein
MLEHAALSYANRTEAERDPALRLSEMVKGAAAIDCVHLRDEVCAAHDMAWLVSLAPAGDYFIHQKVAEHATELRRLADYERRANSLRRKALRRLDYERIGAERRRVGAETAVRHGEPGPGCCMNVAGDVGALSGAGRHRAQTRPREPKPGSKPWKLLGGNVHATN